MRVSVEEPVGASVEVPPASLAYRSNFQRKHLKYAKLARDEVVRLEALYSGESSPDPPRRDVVDHARNTVTAVVHCIAFLEGQKKWFKESIHQDGTDHEDIFDHISQSDVDEIFRIDNDWLEDFYVHALKRTGRNEDLILGANPYGQVKTLREFRNSLLHFESVQVSVGDEAEIYEVGGRLEEAGYPHNSLSPHSSYPHKWFSAELAKRGIRQSYGLWRRFARGLNREEELLRHIPNP